MQILDPSGYPMMSEEEVNIINYLLRKNKCKRCLEYGSGNSTVYFVKENPFIKEWIAVEHKKDYLELLGDKLLGTSGSIVLVCDDEAYPHYPETLNKKFDFILVDGQQREACLEVAFKVASKGAIILLHDAKRLLSAPILEKYKGKYTFISEGEVFERNGFYAHRGLALFKTD